VLVVSRPDPPTEARDAAYQAGYPLPERVGSRPVDRGHFVPYSGGGLFGPKMFVQDRALNRGWSTQGRIYRATETRLSPPQMECCSHGAAVVVVTHDQTVVDRCDRVLSLPQRRPPAAT
jgi:hypothetical protein